MQAAGQAWTCRGRCKGVQPCSQPAQELAVAWDGCACNMRVHHAWVWRPAATASPCGLVSACKAGQAATLCCQSCKSLLGQYRPGCLPVQRLVLLINTTNLAPCSRWSTAPSPSTEHQHTITPHKHHADPNTARHELPISPCSCESMPTGILWVGHPSPTGGDTKNQRMPPPAAPNSRRSVQEARLAQCLVGQGVSL